MLTPGQDSDVAGRRVARIIGRLNIGGPSVQAILLTRALADRGFVVRLYSGTEGPSEGNMHRLACDLEVRPITIPPMQREVGWRDVPALYLLWRALRRFRPDIVHTEAAKAGTLGRLAGLLLGPRRPPVLVHTFHGHSLEGYFSPRKARTFLAVERFLARRTDMLIAVSDEVRDDLLRLGVADRESIRVVPLGLDLSAFQVGETERHSRRARQRAVWGLGTDATVVTLVARLVPIKRVDRFLRIARILSERAPALRFVIVGDGELGPELRGSDQARSLNGRLVWAGFETDMVAVCLASDVVVLTSDNEGTPVSLIEAQAAGRPVVGTRVGGVPSVVSDGVTGYLVGAEDYTGFADAVQLALSERDRLGAAGRANALARFDIERLTNDLVTIYDELVSRRRSPEAPPTAAGRLTRLLRARSARRRNRACRR